MNIPKKVKDSVTTAATMMLLPLGIPQAQLDAAAVAFWEELEGRGVRSITRQEPLDRILSREQAKEILGKSAKTVSLMVKNGTLRGVYGGADGQRLTGVTESSLRAFMAGSKVEKVGR